MWARQEENSPFTEQAATLQLFYHLIQMLIYRPFISSYPTFPSSSENPPFCQSIQSTFHCHAMDICITAARSCARIAEALIQRGISNFPIQLHAAHLSAGMLLIGIWDLKSQEKALRAQGIEDVKPPFVQRMEPLMADVDLFIQMLEWAEPRWCFVSLFLYVAFFPHFEK